MQTVKAADDYIVKFLYKKQVKYDITYSFFLLLSTIVSFLTKNSIWISIIFSIATLAIVGWTIREIKSHREINKHNHKKVRVFYIVALCLHLFMPISTYITGIIFVIPFSILFIDLVETYCGHDSLHWPYIFHFLYGSVFFVLVNIIKAFIPTDVFYVTDTFLLFYNPIAFTMVIDNIAGELIDLRTIFKTKLFRDEIIACYDGLTETHNRYGVYEFCNLEKATAIAMIDLDHFKKVNDTYNHNIGDFVLKEFAKRLSIYGDDNNFICRWGGEEFIIISNSKGDLVDICTKLLISMRNNPILFTFEDKNILHTQTFSCGIAEIVPGKELDEMVKMADIQAYLAKEKGRNHVYMDNEEII